MENENTSVGKSALTYGLYLGIVGIVLSIVLFVTDLFLNPVIGYVTIAISIGLLCWVYIDYKKKAGFLTFGDGFKLGFLANLISGTIVAVFKAVYVGFIDPSIVSKTVEFVIEEAYKKQPEMPDEAVAMIEKIYGFIAGPVGSLVVGILASLIFGAIISLILAAIFKKEPSIFEGSEVTE
jgi:hypothetical protein